MSVEKANEKARRETTAQDVGFHPSSDEIRSTHRLARAGFKWLALTTIVWQTVSWVFTLATIRFLTPSDYGLFNLAETIVPYLLLITQLNLRTWMIRTAELGKQSRETMFVVTVFLGAAVSAATLLIAPWIAGFYENDDLESVIQVIAIIFVLQGIYAVPFALLQRELRFKSIALMELVVNVVRAVLTLYLAVRGLGYWALVVGLLFREVTTAVWLVALRGLPKGFTFDRKVIREALNFGLPATGAAVFWFISFGADNLIVGKVLGVEMLGYYAMAFFLMDLPLAKLSTMIRPILVPYLSRLGNHPQELTDTFLRINQVFVLIVSPILVGLAVASTEAVPIVLGQKWIPMIEPLIGLALFGVIYSLTDNVPPLLHALGYPKKELFISVVSSAVLPVSFVIAASQYGLNGIIAVWFVVYPLITALFLRAVKDTAGLTAYEYLRNLAAPVAAAVMMGLITFGSGLILSLLLGTTALLCSKVVIGVVTYAVIIWLFYGRQIFELFSILRRESSD